MGLLFGGSYRNSQNDVHYSAISKGGISLLEEQEIPSAKYLVSTVLQSGLGIHKQNQLLDILAGKALQIQPELGNYTEGSQEEVHNRI